MNKNYPTNNQCLVFRQGVCDWMSGQLLSQHEKEESQSKNENCSSKELGEPEEPEDPEEPKIMLGFVDSNGKHLGPCPFQKEKEPKPVLRISKPEPEVKKPGLTSVQKESPIYNVSPQRSENLLE
jgi:hypothetical protein